MTIDKQENPTENLQRLVISGLENISKLKELKSRRVAAANILDRVEDLVISLKIAQVTPEAEDALKQITKNIASDTFTRAYKNVLNQFVAKSSDETPIQKRYREFLSNIAPYRELTLLQNIFSSEQIKIEENEQPMPIIEYSDVRVSMLRDLFVKTIGEHSKGQAERESNYIFNNLLKIKINSPEMIPVTQLNMRFLNKIEQDGPNAVKGENSMYKIQAIYESAPFLAILHVIAPVSEHHSLEAKLRGYEQVIKLIKNDILQLDDSPKLEQARTIAGKALLIAKIHETTAPLSRGSIDTLDNISKMIKSDWVTRANKKIFGGESTEEVQTIQKHYRDFLNAGRDSPTDSENSSTHSNTTNL